MNGRRKLPNGRRKVDRWVGKPASRGNLLIVAGLSLAIGAAGWDYTGGVADKAKAAADDATAALHQAETFAAELRDSSVAGCQRQNRVRKRQHEVQDVVREILHDQNEEARHPDPAILELLGLTPEDVAGVSDNAIARRQRHRQDLNHQLPLAPCELAYPNPRTGESDDTN